jgi:DNA-directed RNA polymerase specialized sigma24 family protein
MGSENFDSKKGNAADIIEKLLKERKDIVRILLWHGKKRLMALNAGKESAFQSKDMLGAAILDLLEKGECCAEPVELSKQLISIIDSKCSNAIKREKRKILFDEPADLCRTLHVKEDFVERFGSVYYPHEKLDENLLIEKIGFILENYFTEEEQYIFIFYIEGHTFSNIAVLFDCNPTTISRRYYEIIEKIKLLLWEKFKIKNIF